MTSFVSIANLALSKLGQFQTITNLETDLSKSAKLINSNYQQIRQEMLRMHPWNFAKERVVLSSMTETPAWGGGSYFQVPSDWMRTVTVNDTYPDHEFEGKKILSSGNTLNLVYIKDVTDPNLFDPLFVAAYSSRIAYVNAYGITQSLSTQDAMKKMFEEDIREARRNNAIDRGLQRFVADDFLAYRRS